MGRTTWIAVALSILIQSGVHAADPVGNKLTARLHELLTKEMQHVAKATAKLALAIAEGDHATANELGIAIRDSFILKKSLTTQDKKDLFGAVPPDFVALDRYFHGLADKLAHAAEMKDSELQVFYYSKMLEACVTCHSKFANDRFPGLNAGRTESQKH